MRRNSFVQAALTGRIGVRLSGGGAAETPWWLAGGIPAANAVAVYQPIGAASLAASYVNLANPGTYDAAPGTAPTFDAATGWTFNGSTQYLTTGVTPAGTWTLVVRTTWVGDGGRTIDASSGDQYSIIAGQVASTPAFLNNATLTGGVNATDDVMAMAGMIGYQNGSAIGTIAGAAATSLTTLDIGRRPDNSRYYNGRIAAVAIYNTTLTADQVAAVTTAMDRLGLSEGLDADAETLILAMDSVPDSTRQGHINTLITGLKADGVWDELDELWVMAAHAEQAALLGWKRAKDLTAVNAPAFEVDRGFTGNGTTSYLNTNFVPSTDGVQYTLNDASLGVYSRTNSAAAVRDMMARNVAAANSSGVTLKWTDNKQYSEVNSSSAGPSATVANSLGLGVSRRTASNASQAYRNGAEIATATAASQARPTVSFYIGANNNNGTADAFSTRQYAAAFVGASMSATQQLALFTRLETYLDAIGAGVVS